MAEKFEIQIAGTTQPRKSSWTAYNHYRDHPDAKIVLYGMGVSAITNMAKTVVELRKLLAASTSNVLVEIGMEDRKVADRNNPGGEGVNRTLMRFNLVKVEGSL